MSKHYFPCTAPTPKIREPLVLLNGWMMPNSLWQPLLPTLQAIGDVILLDVAYTCPKAEHGNNNSQSVSAVIDHIVSQLPERSLLIGWSLGGMLAARIAAQFPERVQGVVTLASNVQFVADGHYSAAMAEDTFNNFYQSYQSSPEKTLQQFCGLVAQGDDGMREQRRYLKQQFSDKTAMLNLENLDGLAGLDLLRDMKINDFSAPIQCPSLHILGENDQLVPLEFMKSEFIQNWLQANASCNVEVIAGAGHLLHHPTDRITPMLERFLLTHGSCSAGEASRSGEASCTGEASLNHVIKDETKAAIALSFSRAAASYDQAAQVQQMAGERLLKRMASHIAHRNGVIADVGCGTGFFARSLIQQYTPQHFIGVDLAQGMLDVAAQRHDDLAIATWQQGDAESLPLADQSVDIIYANFSLQWCENLSTLMADFFRVLKPSGYCCFTSLGSETLCELRQAWSTIDQYDHVNPFYDTEQWLPAIQAQGFSVLHQNEYQEQGLYETPMAVLRSLKAIGANVVKGDRSMALTGKRKLASVLSELEQYRTAQGIPATYAINEWILFKQPNC